MTTKNQIRTDALDFDDIKANLKEFLRGQSQFTDYDFDGSAMSIFLDVLAYNTHYNSLYTNLAVNEMFLDSASKYSSAVSLAKTLGYTARSVTSAKAKINVTLIRSGVPSGGSAFTTIPKNSVFTAVIDDEEFNFITTTDNSAQGVAEDGNGVYRFYDIELIEGYRLEKQYPNSFGAKFVIPNKEVDTSTINVRVENNGYTAFGPVANYLTVQGDSNVFFLKQREDLYYEVYFGNDVVGKALGSGDTVFLDYIISSGSRANKANRFTYSSGLSVGYVSILTQTTQDASGGSEQEPIDSIKFNAPRAYAAQNRAVTAEDYKNIIYTNFPNVESVTAWGGQESVPPVYGKVFIAVKPSGANILTTAEKQNMANFLKRSKGVVSVTPEIVDPVFLRIEIFSSVYYNAMLARRSVGEMQTSIQDEISSYTNTLGKFGSTFRHSKVATLIDQADDSIVSNITKIRVRRSVTPIFNKNYNYTISFANPVYQNPLGGSFYSTRFYFSTIEDRCWLKDDGSGEIFLYSEDSSGQETKVKSIGTINYNLGVVKIPSLFVRGLFDELFEFVFQPLSNDVVPAREYIVEAPASLVSVLMYSDSIESSGVKSSTHIFTSSR